jgi:putative selenate reductase FAD-binding subunit
MAFRARVVLADGRESDVEDYIARDDRELITAVIVPDVNLNCIGHQITRSAAGLEVVTAAVSIDEQGNEVIAIGGISSQGDRFSRPVRLRNVENQNLSGEMLEQVVAEAIHPVEDIVGSIEYKRYITGVVVADLLTTCRQQAMEAQQ